MSSDEGRARIKRKRSRKDSPGKHRHKEDGEKRSKNRLQEREEVVFDPHRRIKQEPVSPPRWNQERPQEDFQERHRSRHSSDGERSPRSPPRRDRPHHHGNHSHSGRRRGFHDADDSPPQRDGRHHQDGRRPIKREPPDSPDRRQRQEREQNDERRRRVKREREENDENSDRGAAENWGEGTSGANPPEKDKPNFELSGKLTEDTNTYKGVVIKYNEPPEARKPKRRWRLYPFKGDESLPVLYVHRQSAYLIGRDRRVADLPVDHPSCSKQHAVFQYRLVTFNRDDGSTGRRVRPYIIDLASANGTFLNNKQIEAQKYVELREKDVLKFGFSTREYVLLHEGADTSEVVNEEESD